MTSQPVTPVASTSKVTDFTFTNVKEESTDKGAEKQTVNNAKKKKGIGLVTGWLRMVEPRKVPYFPQKRDKIVYLRQAHECYLKEVVDRKIFDVTESDKLWVQMEIDVFQYLIVTNISFKKFPTRVACLEVRRINEKEEASGPVFKLKYHDMGDVVDFLVLKHIFLEGIQMKWNVGDRFRCLVGNKWFFGIIKSKEPFEKKYPESPFKSFQIKWDDERELDQVSPWELQSINKSRLPKNHGEYVEVLNIEIVKMRYKPCPDDWPNEWKDWKATIKNMISEIDLLMNLPISKCFIEIKNDPVYDSLVSYPIDLSTIKERLVKHFYRRIDSLLLDFSYLKDNAKEHKSEQVFEEAELIIQVCHDILNKCEKDSNDEKDTSVENLKNFLDRFNSSDSNDDDNEYKPNGSSNKKGRSSNYKNNWKIGCKQLLKTLWNSEDMLPFRQPVCREDYPDYYEVITSPICLEEIKAKFHSNLYESPKEMFEDIKLIITNSKTYNKDKERAIYHATTRVSALFEELKKQINSKKESPRKKSKKNKLHKKNESDEFTSPDIGTNSCLKPNEERTICHKEKEKGCNTTNIVTQQKGLKKQKSSIQHETTLDEKIIDSRNNNYKKDLSESLSAKNNYTNLTVERSSSMVVINTKNLPDSANLNEDVRMEVDESFNEANNSTNSDFDNQTCEIVENECTGQFNNEPKLPQISQSQRTDSTESVIVIDSDNDDDEECGKVTKSFRISDDPTHSQAHSAANANNVKMSLQKQSKFKRSLVSTKAKKRMEHIYNRMFQPRPCKSCVTCQNMKQIYLDHVKSHHI